MDCPLSTFTLLLSVIGLMHGGVHAVRKSTITGQVLHSTDLATGAAGYNEETILQKYCLPMEITDKVKCKEQVDKVEKECTSKIQEVRDKPVLARFNAFLSVCVERDRIKLLGMTPPEDDKRMGGIGRAVKVCELDVYDVCQAWTCPTWCEMSHKQKDASDSCKTNCQDLCDNVNMIAGSISPDEDTEATAYKKLQEMQKKDNGIILQALLREHIVKCVCQRRTWKLNKEDWGDVCYKGSQALKPKQKWCDWDAMPSWQALKKEAKVTEYSTSPQCGVKAGVVFKMELTHDSAPTKTDRESLRGDIAAALTQEDGAEQVLGARQVIHLATRHVKDNEYSIELQITNSAWEGTGEDDALKVTTALKKLFQNCEASEEENPLTVVGGPDSYPALADFKARITAKGCPRVVAAKIEGDMSGPPGFGQAGDTAKPGESGAQTTTASLLVFSVIAAATSAH